MVLLKYIKQNIEYIVFFALVTMIAVLILNKSWESFYNEQNGINRLDAVIYINLENRADRKEVLMKDLEKLNTNMNKVHKVSGVFIPKNGHKGCIQSHILALNMIKLNKWKRVLVLEDDAEIDMHPEIVNDVLNKTIDTLDANYSNWDVIMLGTANKYIDEDAKSYKINVSTDDGENKETLQIQKLKTATTSSAYIVKESYVDNILNLFNNCNNNMQHDKLTDKGFEIWALDQKWAELQVKDNWFVLDKDPIKQRAIWSTILRESHS